MQRKHYTPLQWDYLQAKNATLEALRDTSLVREQVKLSLEAIDHSRALMKCVDDMLAEDAQERDRHA